MAVLKFRIYLEEDDSIYRDIQIIHNQYFLDLSDAILKAYDFDNKYEATFYRTNDQWQRGKEISKEVYKGHAYVVPPLIMSDVKIGSEILNPDQKFIFVYDFSREWTFLIELISISNDASAKITYPNITRKEGIGPQQYGTKSMLGDKFIDIEEKYDLTGDEDGFGEDGDAEEQSDESDSDGFVTGDEEMF